jgi:putative DNA primase/helicase
MRAPDMRSPEPTVSGNRVNQSSFAGRNNTAKSTAAALDFAAINHAALASIGAVLAWLLPGGRGVAGEYLALNPRRADTHLGSFKVRMGGGRAGVWSDFATGDHGGDLISLVAYLGSVNQGEAARRLAHMVGHETGGRRHG